jgi:hypothetical protein
VYSPPLTKGILHEDSWSDKSEGVSCHQFVGADTRLDSTAKFILPGPYSSVSSSEGIHETWGDLGAILGKPAMNHSLLEIRQHFRVLTEPPPPSSIPFLSIELISLELVKDCKLQATVSKAMTKKAALK